MEDQALATFNHAAEEMRFHLDREWLVTNYALLVYAALVAAPALVACGRWRTCVSVVAVLLVLLVAWQAWRTLSYSEEIRVLEHARLEEAIKHLPLIHTIRCEKHPPKERWDRPPWVRWLQQLWAFLLHLLRVDELSSFPWGLVVVVGLGAAFASLIILLRIVRRRWAVLVLELVAVVVALGAMFAGLFIYSDVQRVVICPSQPASGGSWPSS